MSENKFKVGDQVKILPGASHIFGYISSDDLDMFPDNVGFIDNPKDRDGDYRVATSKGSGMFVFVAERYLEAIEVPRIIKFSDIQKGDRVRFTQKFGETDSRITEFVVDATSSAGVISNATSVVYGSGYINFYSDDAAKDNCTIELIDRPQPKFAVGDGLTRDDLWRLPAGSVVINTLTNRAFVIDKEGKRLVGNTMTVKFDSARSETIYKIIHIAEEK